MSRGGGDILSSHDLEDVLNVVDGRPSIVEELSAASTQDDGRVKSERIGP